VPSVASATRIAPAALAGQPRGQRESPVELDADSGAPLAEVDAAGCQMKDAAIEARNVHAGQSERPPDPYAQNACLTASIHPGSEARASVSLRARTIIDSILTGDRDWPAS